MRHASFNRRAGLALIALASVTQSLLADDTRIHYDQIKLQTYAAAEVENDTQTAVMYAHKEGPKLAPLTDQVNRLVGQAVQQAKNSEGVKVRTLGYQTSPVYQQQRLSGWRVRQSIRLESQQSERLSELLGQLQSELALESLDYSVSPARRQEVEERLTLQAIDAFRQRAERVTKQMDRSEYRLVEMAIHTFNQQPKSYPMRTGMMALEGASAAPTLEGGSQTLRVEISGTIELQPE